MYELKIGDKVVIRKGVRPWTVVGNVIIDDRMYISLYSKPMHIISNIQGNNKVQLQNIGFGFPRELIDYVIIGDNRIERLV